MKIPSEEWPPPESIPAYACEEAARRGKIGRCLKVFKLVGESVSFFV
jgi:hypothetical protein